MKKLRKSHELREAERSDKNVKTKYRRKKKTSVKGGDRLPTKEKSLEQSARKRTPGKKKKKKKA